MATPTSFSTIILGGATVGASGDNLIVNGQIVTGTGPSHYGLVTTGSADLRYYPRDSDPSGYAGGGGSVDLFGITGRNELVLDGTFGNDSSGAYNKNVYPFRTLTGVFSSSTSGDVIKIKKGYYSIPNVGTNVPLSTSGKELFVLCDPGVILESPNLSSSRGLFNLSYNDRLTLLGYPEIRHRNGPKVFTIGSNPGYSEPYLYAEIGNILYTGSAIIGNFLDSQSSGGFSYVDIRGRVSSSNLLRDCIQVTYYGGYNSIKLSNDAQTKIQCYGGYNRTYSNTLNIYGDYVRSQLLVNDYIGDVNLVCNKFGGWVYSDSDTPEIVIDSNTTGKFNIYAKEIIGTSGGYFNNANIAIRHLSPTTNLNLFGTNIVSYSGFSCISGELTAPINVYGYCTANNGVYGLINQDSGVLNISGVDKLATKGYVTSAIGLTGRSELIVDTNFGDDTSGTYNKYFYPFKTLTGVYGSMVSGDIIRVMPGNYILPIANGATMNIRRDMDITMICEPGVIIDNPNISATRPTFQIADNGSFKLFGYPEIRRRSGPVIFNITTSGASPGASGANVYFEIGNVLATGNAINFISQNTNAINHTVTAKIRGKASSTTLSAEHIRFNLNNFAELNIVEMAPRFHLANIYSTIPSTVNIFEDKARGAITVTDYFIGNINIYSKEFGDFIYENSDIGLLYFPYNSSGTVNIYSEKLIGASGGYGNNARPVIYSNSTGMQINLYNTNLISYSGVPTISGTTGLNLNVFGYCTSNNSVVSPYTGIFPSGVLNITGDDKLVKTQGNQNIYGNKTFAVIINQEQIIPSSNIIDWFNGNIFYETLTGNQDFLFSNESNGQSIDVVTYTTGNFTVTFSGSNTCVKWPGGVAYSGTIGSGNGFTGRYDYWSFSKVNNNIFGSYSPNYY